MTGALARTARAAVVRTAKFETEPFTCPSCITKIEAVQTAWWVPPSGMAWMLVPTEVASSW